MKPFTEKEFLRIWRSSRWKEAEKERPIYTPGLLIGSILVEQVDNKQFLVYDLAERQFVIPDRAENVWSRYVTEEEIILKPLPKLPWRPLPVPHLKPINDQELYEEIRGYIYRKVDFAKETEYDITSAWVMHTWRMENWAVTPYLFFFGPPASGKTWALEVLASISYRPYLGLMSPASLYRMTEAWHPTMFLDETQLYLRGGEKTDILNYLNAGYRRGQTVTRTEPNPKTGEWELALYEVFGAKCLAGTRELLKALETRCFLFIMSRATREIEQWIDVSEADTLRSKLFMYRLKSLADNAELLDMRGFELGNVKDGRLREIFHSLVMVTPSKIKPLFLEHAEKLDRARVQEEALSLESLVFSALVSVRDDRLLIPFREITDRLNLSLLSGESLSSKLVSSIIKKLGFNKRRLSSGVHVIWDDNLAFRLSKRYQVIEIEKSPDIQPHI